MPFTDLDPTTFVTPDRETSIAFDIADPVMVERGWSLERHGADLLLDEAAPELSSYDLASLYQGPDGWWRLRPLQLEQAFYQDDSDVYADLIAASTVDLTQWTYPDGQLGQFPAYARTDLFGMTDVAPTQYSIRKLVDAETNAVASLAASSAAYGPPPIPETSNPYMDRLMESKATYDPDTGFALNFQIPGTFNENPRTVLNFYFGQFCLCFAGNGKAKLWERNIPAPQTSSDWTIRAEFRYAQQKDVIGRPHKVIIWPYRNRHVIDFITDANDKVSFLGGPLNGPSDYARKIQPYVYRYLDVGGIRAGNSYTTAGDVLRVDMHKEARMDLHVSRLAFPTNVTLVEQPAQVELSTGTDQPITLGQVATIPVGCGITGKVIDASTRADLPFLGVGPTGGNMYTLPGGQNAIANVWNFTTDGFDTPALGSSILYKPAVIQTNDPGEWTGGNVRYISIHGQNDDPSHASAQVEIADVSDALSTVVARDDIPFAIRMQAKPPGETDPITINIYRGYTKRARGRLRATEGRLIHPPDSRSFNFPVAQWNSLSVHAAGMFERLQEQVTYRIVSFGLDPAAQPQDANGNYDPEGLPPPWKATDMVRRLFEEVGFPDEMIDVPDIDVRLWSGNKDGRPYVLSENTNISEVIQQVTRDYLGGWIDFDANLGAFGSWRLRQPPTDLTPIAGFTIHGPSGGKLIHVNGSYPQDVFPSTFLRLCEQYAIAPEYNGIIVLGDTANTNDGAGNAIHTQWAINRQSFGTLADRSSEDYRGRMIPLVVGDNTLLDQASLNWMVRRYYDYVCHGRRILESACPLFFVQDPVHGHWRLPMYYDVVSVDGVLYYIRSYNPEWQKDHMQFAHIELQRLPQNKQPS